jgi:hypothetical protein
MPLSYTWSEHVRQLLERASKVVTKVPHKTDLQLFIDFLHEQGTIVSAGPYEVQADGHDVIRFFRPEGGLTVEHFDALSSTDHYASEMLAQAVVEKLLIDRGFGRWKVHWAAAALGYSFWQQVPDAKSFEDASKDVELELYRQNEERKRDKTSKINPNGDWSIIVVRQGTFYLTPLARKVFPVIYEQHLKGLPIHEAHLRRTTGEDVDRFDRCLRSSGIWGTVVGPVPEKRGFWRVIP